MNCAGCVLLLLEPAGTEIASFQQWRKSILANIPTFGKPWVFDSGPATSASTSETVQDYHYLNLYHVSTLVDIPAIVEKALEEVQAQDHVSRWTCHVYKLIKAFQKQEVDPDRAEAPPTLVISGFSINKEALLDFQKWYTEEHMPGMMKIDGYRKGTRYEYVASNGAAGCDSSHWIAVHEWEEPNGLGGEVWKSVVSTPWTSQVLATQIAPMQRTTWHS